VTVMDTRAKKRTRICAAALLLIIAALTVSSGCVSEEGTAILEMELSEAAESIDSVQNALNACQSALDDWAVELAEAEAELAALGDRLAVAPEETDSSPSKPAQIEIHFSPDPVPLRAEEWAWKVVLEEVTGTSVRLDSIVMERHGEGGLLAKWNDESWLKAIDYTLPAHGSVSSNRHIHYDESVTHVVFRVTGVDENGFSIAAEGQVELERTTG